MRLTAFPLAAARIALAVSFVSSGIRLEAQDVSPASDVSPDCAPVPKRGFFSRPQVPMPRELQDRAVVVQSGAVRVGGKAPKIRPYLVTGLEIGEAEGASRSLGLAGFRAAFQVESIAVQQTFSFRLAKEGPSAVPALDVRCAWSSAMTAGELGAGSSGIAMRVPRGNGTLCELSDGSESEPWRLLLWVGPPSRLVPPEYPSGGGLVRGDVRYEATSTNRIEPALMGSGATTITATFFEREGRTVAAVERLVPMRVLMSCATPAAEQAVFVAIGTALHVRDANALGVER